MTPDALPKRFWSKVTKTGTCWLWTAQRNPKGYGLVHWQGRPRRAHRLVAEHVMGLEVHNLEVDHICHNPSCVRPDHLQVATGQRNQENRSGPNANTRSGRRGVSWSSSTGKWRVRVVCRGRAHCGGYFENIADANSEAIRLRNSLMTNNLLDRRTA